MADLEKVPIMEFPNTTVSLNAQTFLRRIGHVILKLG